ncbi:MAG: DsbA family protein [Alphaproteobacteria bacterium]|nr:DsbA family protein [Alphaproteobacteria bacterium]
MKTHLFTALLALVCGFAGAAIWSLSGLGNGQTRDYLVANPEVLPEMAAALQQRESEGRLAEVADAVDSPFPGAVLGNPQGSRTLVKFTDYGCTYCRAAEADVQKLIAADPDLRVVVREWPIFDGSEGAARMALAAAKQGRYPQFYTAMFELGPPSPETVEAAAQQAGLDLAAARSYAASEAVTRELAQNMGLAQQLGFTGTPSWVSGEQIFQGAVGYEALAEAVAADEPA